MARSGNPTNFIPRSAIRIVVAGDAGTGKSSLIISAATNSFPGNIPNVLPPTHLSPDYYSDRVPLIIIDTSSSPGSTSTLVTECNMADVIVLTYAYDRPGSMDRLGSYWLPELRRLEVKVPVIVVGCKLDLRDESNSALEHVLSPIMQQFREIEMCIECSALLQIQVHEVFFFAHKAVLYPTSTLFDQETQSLKPRCASALKRIFNLCDHDRDGALSDADINDFQIKCFNAPLQPLEIAGLREVVQENTHDGVNEHGLTLIGFQYLHALFMERGRPETTWTVLRKFGYSDELKLKDDLFSANFKRAPDQSVELTTEAIEFLKRIFVLFDSDNDGVLEPAEIDDLFSTAPESPWSEYPYKDAAERNVLGGLSLEGFLSQWNLMTLLDPVGSLANLICIGYENDQALAYRMTRRRRQDRKKQQSLRNVLQCFVFGPKNSGKSALISSLIARPFSERWISTTSEQFAANVVELPGGIKKTLVMREIPEDSVNNLLSNRESLAACDIAVFVHDSSDASSFKKATELLIQVASHGENSGFEVPCLIISSKDDLHSYPLAIQDSTRVSHDMGIEMPIPVSSKLSELNNVFSRIVAAAQHPHLSIPETEAGRTRKQYRQLVNRSLMCVSVGAAITVVGLGAYRVYASRKNSSR